MKDEIFLILELLLAISPGGSRASITADSVSDPPQKTRLPPDALDDLTEILWAPSSRQVRRVYPWHSPSGPEWSPRGKFRAGMGNGGINNVDREKLLVSVGI